MELFEKNVSSTSVANFSCPGNLVLDLIHLYLEKQEKISFKVKDISKSVGYSLKLSICNKNSEFIFKFKGLSGISLKHPKCKEGHYSFKKESKDVYSNYVIVSEIKFFFYDVSRLELEEIKDTENIYEITITGFVDRDISEAKIKSLIFQKAGFILAENGVQLNKVLPKFIELPQY